MANQSNIITLGARLVFRSASALRSISKVTRAFSNMQKKARRLREGFSSIATGVRQLALAGSVLALAVGVASSAAIRFESAMSGVNAVLIDATEGEMQQLTAQAKELGRTTIFTATQSAIAQQKLARAGFKMLETMQGLPAILNVAAAEEIDLATATTIVASTLRAFNIEALEAAHVSDVLALASARSNTTIISLGESLKFAAPFAARLGIGFEETAAAIMLLGDAGLRGTIAGTAVKNMLIKLGKPTKEIIDLFGGQKGFNAAVLETKDKLLPLPELIGNIADVLNKDGTILEKTARANKLFGIRGEAAFALIARAGKMVNKEMITMLENSSKMKNEAGEEVGAAAIMAAKRLDNLRGMFILFKSAMEGFFIEMFQNVLKPATKFLELVVTKLQDLVAVMQILNDPRMELNSEGLERYGKFIVAAAKGFLRVSDLMIGIIWELHGALVIIGSIAEWSGGEMTEWAILAAGAAGVLLIAFSGLGVVFIGAAIALGAFSAIISGATAILSIMSLPVVLITAAIAALVALVGGAFTLIVLTAFQVFRRDTEGISETLVRAFGKIGEAASWLFLHILSPMFHGFISGVVPPMREAIRQLIDVWIELQSEIDLFFKKLGITSTDIIKIVFNLAVALGKVVGGIALIMVKAISFMAKGIAGLMRITETALGSKSFRIALMISKPSLVPLLKDVGGVDGGTANKVKKVGRDIVGGGQIGITEFEEGLYAKFIAGQSALEDIGEDFKGLEVTTKTDICIDKKKVASAVGKTKQDAIERGGGSQTAWQRRQSIEDSVVFSATR